MMACFTNIATYDMHGFQDVYANYYSCVNHMIAIQKYWLADCNLHIIINVHDDDFW